MAAESKVAAKTKKFGLARNPLLYAKLEAAEGLLKPRSGLQHPKAAWRITLTTLLGGWKLAECSSNRFIVSSFHCPRTHLRRSAKSSGESRSAGYSRPSAQVILVGFSIVVFATIENSSPHQRLAVVKSIPVASSICR